MRLHCIDVFAAMLPGSLLHRGREASVSTRRASEWQSGNQLTGTPINESFSQRVHWNLPPCPIPQLPVSMTTLPFCLPIHPPAIAGGQVRKVPGGVKMPLARSATADGDDHSVLSTWKKWLHLLSVTVKQNQTVPGQPGLAARHRLVTAENCGATCVQGNKPWPVSSCKLSKVGFCRWHD